MRVGFFSVAHLHANSYVHNLRNIAGVTVVGAADADSSLLEPWANKHDVRIFDSCEALIEADLDAVLVCSANNEHLEHVKIAAAAGVGVFCEKPLATTLADATELVEVCEAAEVVLMTAFPMRFSPALASVKSSVADGELGEVRALVGVNQAVVPFGGKSWFSDKTRAGGGAVMDHVVHLADTYRWLLDEDIVEVYGQTNKINHSELDVETGGLVMVTMRSGVIATIDCSWSRPDAHPIWGGLEVDVIGSEGVVSVDAFSQKLQISTNIAPNRRLPGWGDDLGQLMINEFVAAVREHRQPKVSGRDGLLATEVALGVYESLLNEAPVALGSV